MPPAVRSSVLTLLAAALCAGPARDVAAQAKGPEPGVTAQAEMARVEALAAAGHKQILLSFGASWCGNCRLFDRFLADPAIHAILEPLFVFAELTTGERPGDTRHANTPGGQDVENELGGKTAGFPYIVMLDRQGRLLANSLRPTGKGAPANIGYPDSAVEIAWFMEMLKKAAPDLTPANAATVQAWLTSHSSGHA